jgi:hypothetical protein
MIAIWRTTVSLYVAACWFENAIKIFLNRCVARSVRLRLKKRFDTCQLLPKQPRK